MWSIADIGLCTSDSEGMPLALIEAQYSGIPVVSTNVGSVAEIVEDGVTGSLASGEITSLVIALKKVLNQIKKNQEMQKSSRKRAKRMFSSEVMTQAHLNLYMKVLGKVAE
jgi:glycosyltransferase involved in cell wall biosynthesis